MAQERLRLTREHRLVALERETVVLRDKVDMLHAMLKQQRQLINEYITRQIVMPEEAASRSVDPARNCEACRRRFERLERQVDQLEGGERILRRQAV